MKTSSSNTSLRQIRLFLFIMVGLLAALHIISLAVYGDGTAFAKWFDLDRERNIPTVYNGLLWGSASLLSFLLFSSKGGKLSRLWWLLLGCLYFYFAFDEILVLHEGLAAPIRDLLSIGAGNVFYHAWILPAIAVVALLCIVTATIRGKDTMSREQRSTLKLTIILALVVIALEAVGTQLYFSPLGYKLGPVLVEEMFEIGMVSLIVYKLTSYLLRNS